MICEKCGQEYGIGDWPFCKGGHGRFRPEQLAVVDDTVDWTIENMSATPEHFTSRSEWRRRCKELGLVNAVRHVPVQGSDKSPHTTRWV